MNGNAPGRASPNMGIIAPDDPILPFKSARSLLSGAVLVS